LNRKAVVGLVKVMMAVVILILILALAGPGRHFITLARNVTDATQNQVGLGCVLTNGSTNNTLTDFQSANCIAVDLINPFFVFVVIGIAGAIIIGRVVLT